MNLTYNDEYNPSDMLTFSEVPNILKIEELNRGTNADILFTFSNGLNTQVSEDGQYYITFLGETITNTISPQNATNKRFYIAQDAESTAASVTKALRNCASISADFFIVNGEERVQLYAKTIGRKFSGTQQQLLTNIPTEYLEVAKTDGEAYSDYYGSKITIDVYNDQFTYVNKYITTIEKNFYGDECAFNMTPILATLSEYGKIQPYLFVINKTSEDGTFSNIGKVSGNTTVGYHANQSDRFLNINGVKILMNNRRDGEPYTLYTYGNTIPLTLLISDDTNSWNFNVSCKNSAMEEIYNRNGTKSRASSTNILETTYMFPQDVFNQTYYIDITEGSDTVRFNVIKPLKAAEGYQRILWRNEYGGVSFFDFTSTRSESDSVDIETYEKNIFDYYTAQGFEKKKIYSNNYTKEVTLTSHLMNEKGKYIFNSLMQSKQVETVIGNEQYYIIPKSIEITENDQYNGIYTAKLVYTYSDI